MARPASRTSPFAKTDARQHWRAVRKRRPDIASTPLGTTAVDITGELCDRFTEDANGGTYSVSAVCAALGVPDDEWPLFTRWAIDFLDPVALDELYAHLDVMIADRCSAPGEDLLSDLIAREVDGDGLTVDDLHTIVATLLAGIEVS